MCTLGESIPSGRRGVDGRKGIGMMTMQNYFLKHGNRQLADFHASQVTTLKTELEESHTIILALQNKISLLETEVMVIHSVFFSNDGD